MTATHNANSFKRFVPHATPEAFAVVTSSREYYRFGSGPTAFVVRVPNFASWERIATASAYSVATAFVHGEFDIEGDLLAAIRWWHSDRAEGPAEWFMKLASRLRIESMFQTMGRARRNVAFHYDRSNVFYQQFLDSRMVYSCAYFADPQWSLDEAQLAKLDHICHKLDIAPGDRFLDVGCGELQRLLKYCRTHKGRVHFVIVFNLTRFAREKYDHFALRAHLNHWASRCAPLPSPSTIRRLAS